MIKPFPVGMQTPPDRNQFPVRSQRRQFPGFGIVRLWFIVSNAHADSVSGLVTVKVQFQLWKGKLDSLGVKAMFGFFDQVAARDPIIVIVYPTAPPNLDAA
ncbi:MAG: hypothetical protein V2I40_01440, partial [Desulfobacteraceae bacterium]|nr:hypothetical protein [Desulfobacteraceae bacterium]